MQRSKIQPQIGAGTTIKTQQRLKHKTELLRFLS